MSAQIIQFPGAPSPTLASMVMTLQANHLSDLNWREHVLLFRVASGLAIGSDADQAWAGEQLERVSAIWRRVTG